MSEGKIHTVLLYGPPGSGKGTQGRVLGGLPGMYHCASGDVFRQLHPRSEYGQLVGNYLVQGDLVPDDLSVKIWKDHIHKEIDRNNFHDRADMLLLDGIPRTVEQCDMLSDKLDVLAVLNMVCKDEEKLIRRLRMRAMKENRPDDAKESVIRHRMEVYHETTAPVLEYYPQEIQAEIDAMKMPGEVLIQILEVIVPIQKVHMVLVNGY